VYKTSVERVELVSQLVGYLVNWLRKKDPNLYRV